jgi:hypothetical protein
MTSIDRSAAAAIALRQFVLDLREARRTAGEPPYATLVQRMNREFSKATISRVLNGARPSWHFTLCFLGACGVSDSAIMETWRPKWTALQNALRPFDLHGSIEDANGPRRADCTICGAWATNPSLHADYHRQRGDVSPSCADSQMLRKPFDGERA